MVASHESRPAAASDRTEPSPAFGGGLQRARVCQILLSLVGESERWGPAGPSPASRAVPSAGADADGARMLAACWALWEGSSTLTLSELLRLAPDRLEAVGELLAALARGPAAIDQWITRFGASGLAPCGVAGASR